MSYTAYLEIFDIMWTPPKFDFVPRSSAESKEYRSTPWAPSRRLYLAFSALAVLALIVALDGTSISVALPRIADTLGGNALKSFWAGTSFLLASMALQPIFASFSSIFGRMPVIMSALLLFLVGSLVSAVSKDLNVLLAGRTLQGAGGGGLIVLLEIVVTDLVPLRHRGQWYGIISAMWACGSVSGPVIGGVFAHIQWRWIFWINVPFIAFALVMIPWFLRLKSVPASAGTKLRRVDWTGSILFICSITAFTTPLTYGGVLYSWDDWRTLLPLLLSVVGLVGFALYEYYLATDPLFRLSVFHNASVNIAFICTTIHGIILWCLLYYLPLYYEAVKEYTPAVAGLALFPATFTVAPVSLITGLLVSKMGRYRWTIWAAWTISTVGLGLATLIKADATVPQWVLTSLVSGIGLGMLFPALQFQLQAASTSYNLESAVAIFTFCRSCGQCLGVALGGVIFQNRMVSALSESPVFRTQAGELAKNAVGLIQSLKQMPDGPDKQVLKNAYTDSLRAVYMALCVLAAFALLLSLFTKEYPLDLELHTKQGFVDCDGGYDERSDGEA